MKRCPLPADKHVGSNPNSYRCVRKYRRVKAPRVGASRNGFTGIGTAGKGSHHKFKHPKFPGPVILGGHEGDDIDPESYDLLRIELQAMPFEFEKPNGRGKMKYEYELTDRFKPMIFENPKQTLMVPESMESVWIVRGSPEPTLRTVHSFSNFKRFSAGVQIIGAENGTPSR